MKKALLTLRKMSTVKELVGSLVPTGFAYNDILKHFFSNPMMSLVLAILAFLLLFLILILIKADEYEKSISEILATGYFNNYVIKLAGILRSRGNSPVKLLFSGNRSSEISADKIRVELMMPGSLAVLRRIQEETDAGTEIVYIDSEAFNHPYWLRARMDADGQLNILEYPRTLFALPKFLISDPDSYNEKVSRKFHSAFIRRFEQLWQQHTDEIPVRQFSIKNL
jgi:hypothetical protein